MDFIVLSCTVSNLPCRSNISEDKTFNFCILSFAMLQGQNVLIDLCAKVLNVIGSTHGGFHVLS